MACAIKTIYLDAVGRLYFRNNKPVMDDLQSHMPSHMAAALLTDHPAMLIAAAMLYFSP